MRRVLHFLLLCSFATAAIAADNAGSMLASGRIDDAISTLRGELNGSPSNAEAHNLLCRAYFTLEDWDRGISACERAVELEPGNSTYHLWLGRIYGEKADASSFITAAGLAKKVRTEFERAVQLSPQNVAARTDLAEFYLEAPGIVGGGQDKARNQAQTLAQLDPSKAHWVNARIAEKQKNTAVAEKEYRAALDAAQGEAGGWLDLAIFYRHTGRLDEMEKAVAQLAAAPLKKPEVLVDAADTLFHGGRNFPQAIQLLKRYLSSGELVEEAPAFRAHYLLGTILEKQGDRPGAAQEYRAALSLARDFGQAKAALRRVGS